MDETTVAFWVHEKQLKAPNCVIISSINTLQKTKISQQDSECERT